MNAGRLPAWCELRPGARHDGRYVVACYYTHDGHPVAKAHAEKVVMTEYHPDGTPLLTDEAVVEEGAGTRAERLLVSSAMRFAR
jgi:hypothetical protein